MSAPILPQVLFCSKLKGTLHHLLMVIAFYLDYYKDKAEPSVATLAGHLGIKERQCYRLLRQLEAGGHLAIRREKPVEGKHHNYYTILRPWATPVLEDIGVEEDIRGALDSDALQRTPDTTPVIEGSFDNKINIYQDLQSKRREKASETLTPPLSPRPVVSPEEQVQNAAKLAIEPGSYLYSLCAPDAAPPLEDPRVRHKEELSIPPRPLPRSEGALPPYPLEQPPDSFGASTPCKRNPAHRLPDGKSWRINAGKVGRCWACAKEVN